MNCWLQCYDVWCLTELGCRQPLEVFDVWESEKSIWMTNVLINQCLDYRDLCQPTLTLSDTVCPDEVEESDKVCNWNNTATAQQCLIGTVFSLYFIFCYFMNQMFYFQRNTNACIATIHHIVCNSPMSPIKLIVKIWNCVWHQTERSCKTFHRFDILLLLTEWRTMEWWLWNNRTNVKQWTFAQANAKGRNVQTKSNVKQSEGIVMILMPSWNPLRFFFVSSTTILHHTNHSHRSMQPNHSRH